ncbi:hypothetical protein [Nonomuraea polychroma]|nr:hypothetical protein [Nonomuraea polychroma]
MAEGSARWKSLADAQLCSSHPPLTISMGALTLARLSRSERGAARPVRPT